MTSYVNSTLISEEQVVYEAWVSKWCLLPHIVLGLLLLPVFGVGLVFWARAAIIYWTTELAVTNKRVIAKTGLIRRNTIEMFLSKVESVHVEQSVLGRIFDFGTVMISGTGVHNAPFRGISQPLLFRKEFMTAADLAAVSSSQPGVQTVEVQAEPVIHPSATVVEPPTTLAPEPAPTPKTLEERLVELKRLFDAGLITPDVYAEQQRRAIEAQS